MKYGISFHSYKEKETKILKYFTDKYTCLEALQEYAYKFIYDKEGFKWLKVYSEGDHERPYGYFIERNAKKNLNSFKIRYKKWENGYIYKSVDFDDICVFSMIMCPSKKKIKYSYQKNEDTLFKNKYSCVLTELLKCVNKIETNEKMNYKFKKKYDKVMNELNARFNKAVEVYEVNELTFNLEDDDDEYYDSDEMSKIINDVSME